MKENKGNLIFQILEEPSKQQQEEILGNRTSANFEFEENITKNNDQSILPNSNDEHPTLKCEASFDNINSSVIEHEIKEKCFEDSVKISAKFLPNQHQSNNIIFKNP